MGQQKGLPCIHGTLLASTVEQKPAGTSKAEHTAGTRMLEFQRICKHLNAQFDAVYCFYFLNGLVGSSIRCIDEYSLINPAEQQYRAQCA